MPNKRPQQQRRLERLAPQGRTAFLSLPACSIPSVFLHVLSVVVVAMVALGVSQSAQALETITVPANQDVIELTTRGTLFENRGDRLQVETAPGPDGVVGRISVKANTRGTNPSWIVFALRNETDTVMERWLTSSRYTLIGSGIIWPNLDARRLEAVTPSIGFLPERVKSDQADVFRLTLEPGQTVTFAVEMASTRFSRVFLWKPIAYELNVRESQIYNGALLGLTGLLGLVMTALFAANHKIIFPSAALVAWCVMAYLCIDFGLFHKTFNLRPEDNAVYRAGAEAAMAASFVIFLHTFLRLRYAHGIFRMLLSVWILAQLALVAIAVVDPRLAATFARLSFLLIGGAGALMILFLTVRGQDRALMLSPTWLLFLVWIFAVAVALTGRLAGDVVIWGLNGGLVLIVLLIAFTVMQFAFRSLEPVYGAAPDEQQLRSLAVDGANAATWEWNARRDEVKVSPMIEAVLGLNAGELSTKVDDFISHIHPADRERFRLTLWSIKERTNGRMKIDFQLRHADNTYRWFELEASTVTGAEGRNVRCVGLMRDVSETRLAQQRLMNDAVNCHLTGLPNRELFLDRLATAMRRAQTDPSTRPTVLYIDIDRFRSVNSALGLVVGDTLLLTLARRMQHHLTDDDTLARMNGDQFAVLLLSEQEPRALAELAERLRRSMRAPIRIAGKEIVLTGSLGIAVYDGQSDHRDLVREAEIAMYRAKRTGADKVEIFRPEMRETPDDRLALEAELRLALENDEITVYYQPIIYLPTEELAGFEALVRWQHPKRGLLPPAAFVPVAEESDLIVDLGSYVLMKAAHTAAQWHKELPRTERELFVSVNVSSRQLLRQDLVQNVRHLLGRGVLPKGTLRLEITESLVMENPEAAVELLKQLSGAGAEIALDDFGTGYSSLAYLQRFPFDTIKIDRQFMASDVDQGEGSAGPAIVRSVVALAHELGKTVVAEGVEDPDEVSFLRAIGCEYAQGFYYGEPMSKKDVVQLLRIVRRSERKLEGQGLFRLKRKAKTGTAEQDALDAEMVDDVKALPAKASLNGKGKTKRKGGSKPADGASVTAAANGGGDQPPMVPETGVIEQLPGSLVRPMRGAPGARPVPQRPQQSGPPHGAPAAAGSVSQPPVPNGPGRGGSGAVAGAHGNGAPLRAANASPPPPGPHTSAGRPASGPPPPVGGVRQPQGPPPQIPGGTPKLSEILPSPITGVGAPPPPPAPGVPPPLASNGGEPSQPGPPPGGSSNPKPSADLGLSRLNTQPASPPTAAQPPRDLSDQRRPEMAGVPDGGDGDGALPDFSTLPPGIAASLAKLAGTTRPSSDGGGPPPVGRKRVGEND